MKNVSFHGSPVQFQLDSPLLLCFDPLCLAGIRDLLASWPTNAPIDVGLLLERVNNQHPAMSCYRIANFQPGLYSLDPRDIHKFGDEEPDLDYDGVQEDELGAAEVEVSFPFVSVDSGALILVDFGHMSKLVNLFGWDQYDLALQDDTVFSKISEALGGPYFAVIHGASVHGMQFDGDGTYTIKAGAVRPTV
jgi:hypothetical protein